jgi:hypothetical protein
MYDWWYDAQYWHINYLVEIDTTREGTPERERAVVGLQENIPAMVEQYPDYQPSPHVQKFLE